MNRYTLLQFQTILEPMIDEYLSNLDIQIKEIKDYHKKLKAKYALLFMFNEGKKND